MKLVLDIGNTFTKIAVFEKQAMHSLKILRSNEHLKSIDYIRKLDEIYAVIVSSVVDIPDELLAVLQEFPQCVVLDAATPLPISIDYKTPATLGRDRIAAMVAAAHKFPGHNVLSIDAGTCITYDFLHSENCYMGGSISPGVSMRFKALHTFTGQLPLMDGRHDCCFIGKSTAESILSGVLNGIVYEMEGFIKGYTETYEDLRVIVSGGDMIYFEKRLKSSIFAVPNMVLLGLNQILDFNAA